MVTVVVNVGPGCEAIIQYAMPTAPKAMSPISRYERAVVGRVERRLFD